MKDPESFMTLALSLAREAMEDGEVPVGCVIIDSDGSVIGTGRNRREKNGDATAHAEVEAIRAACRKRGTWRLSGCSLYVTLEPCPMCAGAIINARISDLYFGASEPHTGSCGSVLNLFMEPFGHEPRIRGGVMKEACAELMQVFFSARRETEETE